MKRMPVTLLSLLTLSVGLSAHAWAENKRDNPNDIGKRKVAQWSLVSQEKEIAIGKQYAEQIDRTTKLITDSVVTEYVNRVEQNIARNSDVKIPVSVKVIDDPAINAMTLPGGFIYVNSGLLQSVTSEDQLAGVLAHETGHVALRSWASLMTKQTILQFATIPLLFVPMSLPVYYGVSEAYMNGVPVAFLKFDRGQEKKADFLGIQYLWKAGYDPNAFIQAFAKIVQDSRRHPGSVPSIFMDHPPTGDRIVASEEEIKTLLPTRPEYLVSTSEFNDVRARLEADVTALRIHNQEEGAPSLGKKSGKTGKKDEDKPPVLKRRGD